MIESTNKVNSFNHHIKLRSGQMAKTMFEKGDVFKVWGTDKVGVVVNDVFVIIVDSIDSTGIHLTTESYPQKMDLVRPEDVNSLPFETQCIVRGIKATLFFVTL